MQPAKLSLLIRSLARREPIRADGTDALRIVDGRGDGLDDFEIDDFAGRWLVQTRGGTFPEWLREHQPQPAAIYWKKLAQSKEPPVWVSGEKLTAPFVAH